MSRVLLTIYINRDGAMIPKDDWEARQKDDNYRIVRTYDNGEVYAEIVWVGRVVNPDDTWPDMWKIFQINVFNYNEFGDKIADPVMFGKWYSNLLSAESDFEAFLVKWTDSHINEDGKYVEADNLLAPPPAPNLDAPTSDIEHIKGLTEDGVGAW